MRFTLLAAIISLAVASPAAAGVEAEQSVQKVTLSESPSGEPVETLSPAVKVAPGETVIYTLNYRNSPDSSSENVVFVMPVPAEVVYVEGSVTGEPALVSFSADGGESFMTRGRLTIREGEEVRVATSDEITHIRWVISSLDADATGAVSYRGILK
jgi:uncharacterized repeat protein (TIGR01451 family)